MKSHSCELSKQEREKQRNGQAQKKKKKRTEHAVIFFFLKTKKKIAILKRYQIKKHRHKCVKVAVKSCD